MILTTIFLSPGGVTLLVPTISSPFSATLFLPLFSFLSLCVLCALFLHPFLALRPSEANFVLPEAGDFLDEVTFAELQRDEAEKLVKQYNEEGRRAAPPPEKRYDNRQTGYRGQSSSFQRYDNRGGPRGGYQNRGSSGGGYRPGPYSVQ